MPASTLCSSARGADVGTKSLVDSVIGVSSPATFLLAGQPTMLSFSVLGGLLLSLRPGFSPFIEGLLLFVVLPRSLGLGFDSICIKFEGDAGFLVNGDSQSEF